MTSVLIGIHEQDPGRAAVRGTFPAGRDHAADPVLVVAGLVKHYGSRTALDGFDLTVRAGEIAGLVGHNGAGKSTLMRLAAGQLRPDIGRVCVGGHDAWSAEAKMHIGFCPDHDTFYEDMSGRRFVDGP